MPLLHLVSTPDVLNHRELKVHDAQTALVATLRWRDEMKIDEIMKEEFPEKVFGGAGRNFGHDKQGHPVTCVLQLSYHSCVAKAHDVALDITSTAATSA